jgi:hypothetical protein
MRSLLPFIVLLAFGAMPADGATRNFGVSGFDRVRVDGPFKVTLTTGVAPFASATGSPAAIDGVAIDVQGRTLVVHSNRSDWGGYPGRSNGPVEINVGTHDLTSAVLNGSGSLSIDKIRGLSFDFMVQGSGAAAIGNVAVDQLKIGLVGASNATIAGIAPQLTAIVRGISSLDAAGLMVKDATIGAQGSVTVKANVSNSAKIDTQGAALVDLAGQPACTIHAAGSASVVGCR